MKILHEFYFFHTDRAKQFPENSLRFLNFHTKNYFFHTDFCFAHKIFIFYSNLSFFIITIEGLLELQHQRACWKLCPEISFKTYPMYFLWYFKVRSPAKLLIDIYEFA